MIPGVFVIVPAYNEGRALAATLESLVPFGYDVVVVDDGSADDTLAVAVSATDADGLESEKSPPLAIAAPAARQ